MRIDTRRERTPLQRPRVQREPKFVGITTAPCRRQANGAEKDEGNGREGKGDQEGRGYSTFGFVCP